MYKASFCFTEEEFCEIELGEHGTYFLGRGRKYYSLNQRGYAVVYQP